MQRIKNDRFKHIAVCKVKTCTSRVHCSRFQDGVTWKIKSLKGSHSCPRLQDNKMASHSWVAQQLVTDFKTTPTMQAANMQKLIMEMYGVSVPRHTCDRAKKPLKSWVGGKHKESYVRLVEYIEKIKEAHLGTIASCISQGPDNAPLFKRMFISFAAMIILSLIHI